MSENCSHNCESCGESCSERERESLLAKPHDGSHIKKVIGVVSGKGGVGKSLVTSMLAVMLHRREGYSTADVWTRISPARPSPPLLGIHLPCRRAASRVCIRCESQTGIRHHVPQPF